MARKPRSKAPSEGSTDPKANIEAPPAPSRRVVVDVEISSQELAARFPPPRVTVRPQPGGSQTKYTPVLAAQIVQRMAVGETLRSICKDPEVGVSEWAFRTWVLTYPELREAWEAAKKIKASSLFDEALDIARELQANKTSASNNQINALRVAGDTLKWAAARLSPVEYGDRAPVVPAVAIQINTSLDLGDGRSKDTVAPKDGAFTYVLQAKPLAPEQPTVVDAEVVEEGRPRFRDPAEARRRHLSTRKPSGKDREP